MGIVGLSSLGEMWLREKKAALTVKAYMSQSTCTPVSLLYPHFYLTLCLRQNLPAYHSPVPSDQMLLGVVQKKKKKSNVRRNQED